MPQSDCRVASAKPIPCTTFPGHTAHPALVGLSQISAVLIVDSEKDRILWDAIDADAANLDHVVRLDEAEEIPKREQERERKTHGDEVWDKRCQICWGTGQVANLPEHFKTMAPPQIYDREAGDSE